MPKPRPKHDRRHPVHGVKDTAERPTIVFLTVCTKDRRPWLATAQHHELLTRIWKSATAWHAGRYVLMPDHLHIFATPDEDALPFDNWVRYWKSQFSKAHANPVLRWQVDHWDRRLRSSESYEEKSQYMWENPVRAGLVQRAEDWPYQGEVFELPW